MFLNHLNQNTPSTPRVWLRFSDVDFHSTLFKIMVRNGLILNHDFKEDLVILHFFTLNMDETLIRLKKFATLLPKYFLAETPRVLALMRLGRQSAEKERISEIKRTFKLKKLQTN
ncbi:hypothetical protein AM232_12150 [Bacillus sp. FJAT-21352]|nr:hypothetical protein AM232_12150 [Bacillus sp. FJAT-21352]